MKNYRAFIISLIIHLFIIAITLGFYFHHNKQKSIIINLEQAQIIQASMIALTSKHKELPETLLQNNKTKTPPLNALKSFLNNKTLPKSTNKNIQIRPTIKVIKKVISKNNSVQRLQRAQQQNAITQKILKSIYNQISLAVSQIGAKDSLTININATLLPEGKLINILITGEHITPQIKKDISVILEKIHTPEVSKKLAHSINIRIPIRIENEWN